MTRPISAPPYSFSPAARLARIEVALRVDPNKLSDWRGSLRDWGFALYTRGEGTNGNLPTLYTMRCDGQEFYFDGPFHVWLPVSAAEQNSCDYCESIAQMTGTRNCPIHSASN